LRDPEGVETILPKFIAETLRLHPPAFVEGRQLREDTFIEIYDDNDRTLKKMLLKKGRSILCLTQAAALDPLQYQDPALFNPYRFHTVPAPLPWYPFAAGTHVCPGQYLANAELKALITQIVAKYDIETLAPANPIEQRGYFTLRTKPAVLRLSERKE
jgi:cytochrome P450